MRKRGHAPMWNLVLEAASLLGLYVEAAEEARRHPHLWLYDDATLALYDFDVSTAAGRRKYARRYARALRRLERSIAAQPTGESPARSCEAFADVAHLLAEHFQRAGWLEREEAARGLHLRAVRIYAPLTHQHMAKALEARTDCWRRQLHGSQADRTFVRDIAFLLDEWTLQDRRPCADLVIAIDRLLAGGITQVGEIALAPARSRATSLLQNN